MSGGVNALVSSDLEQRLISLRRDLHAHPELSFQEERTAGVLTEFVQSLQPAACTRVANTGIVARIRGRNPGAPLVAIRGDIDALPIEEKTGLSFASSNTGVMHACGHDVHATWAVGAAALLSAAPAEGDVLIVLQPAEETGRGAKAFMDAGALDGVRAIFGGHVDRRFTIGQVVAQAGPLAASADIFTITLNGRGAHAARPHESADPIVGAAALVAALQTVVSRRIRPDAPAVLTVGSIAGGTAPNIIPDRVTLRGTLRATDSATRAALQSELQRVTQGISAAHDLTAQVVFDEGVPPVVNTEREAAWAAHAVTSVLDSSALAPLGITNMAAEDFAWYLETIPGCFMRVGARRDGERVIPAHSPEFDVAEEAIAVGAAVLAECARVASAALARGHQ